jgi:hypothetical protein
MDLKLGTKQYTVDTPSEKRKKRNVKAVATTSAKLGFRLGGVRVRPLSLSPSLLSLSLLYAELVWPYGCAALTG